MAGLRYILFLGVLCSCSMLGFGDIVPPVVIPVDTTVAVSGTTDEPVTTTLEPDTTTKTTTAAPNTTTSSTTTTTTTTTTPAPPTPTPTPPAPTPAPTPKPVPAPTQGTWVYTDAANVTCIVAQFAAQITLSYSKNVLNKTAIANITMNVPSNATVFGGSCNTSATEQWLQIGWMSEETDGIPAAPNTILMLFRKNDTTKTYSLHEFNLTIAGSQLINSSAPAESIVLSHSEEWSTPLATSYRCAAVSRLGMSNDTYSVSASVAVSALQEEAFRTAPGKGFSAARDCGSGDVPDAVPIAVGCALGGLVLVVLAAYLVARRRSAARGYLSM